MSNLHTIRFSEFPHQESFAQQNMRARRLEQKDSHLHMSWLILSLHTEKGDAVSVGIEILSLLEAQTESDHKEKARLQSARAALIPLVLEYRAALLALDGATKSKDADFRGNSIERFNVSWLQTRLIDAFPAIIDLPLVKMKNAALAFKPATTATYEADLKINGNLIKLIAPADLTLANCKLAVQTSPGALQLIPGHLRTREICLAAFGQRCLGSYALEHVPVQERDDEMCIAAVRSNAQNLKHVPLPLRTVELCALACAMDGMAWNFVPEHARVPEVQFCHAFHGFDDVSSGAVFENLEKIDSARANAMFHKYNQLLIDLHYPHCDDDELADLGMPTNSN